MSIRACTRLLLLKSGVKSGPFMRICLKTAHLHAKFMQQSIKLRRVGFSRPAILTCELDAGFSLLSWLRAES